MGIHIFGNSQIESSGAASTIFYTFGMVRQWDSNQRPLAPKADTLPSYQLS